MCVVLVTLLYCGWQWRSRAGGVTGFWSDIHCHQTIDDLVTTGRGLPRWRSTGVWNCRHCVATYQWTSGQASPTVKLYQLYVDCSLVCWCLSFSFACSWCQYVVVLIQRQWENVLLLLLPQQWVMTTTTTASTITTFHFCLTICSEFHKRIFGANWRRFYQCDAMLAWILAVGQCLWSVWLSLAGIVSKWLHWSSWFLAYRLPLFCFTLSFENNGTSLWNFVSNSWPFTVACPPSMSVTNCSQQSTHDRHLLIILSVMLGVRCDGWLDVKCEAASCRSVCVSWDLLSKPDAVSLAKWTVLSTDLSENWN